MKPIDVEEREDDFDPVCNQQIRESDFRGARFRIVDQTYNKIKVQIEDEIRDVVWL